jgi:hypothetical protein
MGGIDTADALYELIAEELESRLAIEPPRPLNHWMLISDAKGITICRLDDDTEGMAVDSVLASHVEGGASAAAFITAHTGFVLAQVLLAEPRNSDLRRAPLKEDSGKLRVGSWAPAI